MKYSLITTLLGLALASAAQAAVVPISASPSPDPHGGRPEQVNHTISQYQHRLDDEEFIRKAVMDNLAAIEMSRLALSRSNDPKIRARAEHNIHERSQANLELRHLANAKKIMTPAMPSREQQRTIDRLQEQSGGDFDRGYARQMRRGHDDALALYSNAADSRSLDPRVRAFANEKLPALEMHRRWAYLDDPGSGYRVAHAGNELSRNES